LVFLLEAFPGFTSRPAAFSIPGAAGFPVWSCVMEVPLSKLLEEAVDIAWVYLHRTGEIVDGIVAARFLTDTIETMIRRGQRNRMFLANMAILKYQASRSNVVDIREHA
jgi:hypothetical protein